jgi:hypothetical protein
MLSYCGLELGWFDFSSSIAVLCVRKGVISLVDIVVDSCILRLLLISIFVLVGESKG